MLELGDKPGDLLIDHREVETHGGRGLEADELLGIDHRLLDIEGNIQQYRSRPSFLAKPQRFLQLIPNIFGLQNHFRVLRDRSRHGDDVGLLESDLANGGIGPEKPGVDLAGQKHAGHGVIKAVAHRREKIHPARSARGNRHTGHALHLGIGLGCKPAGLLVHDGDVFRGGGACKRIDQVTVGGAVDHEHLVDSALRQCMNDEVCNLDHDRSFPLSVATQLHR